MPTIHFEYTDNLNLSDKIKPFLTSIHKTLVDIIHTDLATCRSLIVPHTSYVVGDGNANNAFLQLTIKILPGRSADLKKQLGAILFEKIQNTFSSEIAAQNTQCRVYVQETNIDYYFGLNQ